MQGKAQMLELLDMVKLATESQGCFRSEVLARLDRFEEEMRSIAMISDARMTKLSERISEIERKMEAHVTALLSAQHRQLRDVESRVVSVRTDVVALEAVPARLDALEMRLRALETA
jgi:tetrahydromethanopterin S-methyltransferase subunit G